MNDNEFIGSNGPMPKVGATSSVGSGQGPIPIKSFGKAIAGGGGGFDGPRVGGQGSQENIARGIHPSQLPNSLSDKPDVPPKVLIKTWKGLSAEAKLHFIRYAPTWTTLELIEIIEQELKELNS